MQKKHFLAFSINNYYWINLLKKNHFDIIIIKTFVVVKCAPSGLNSYACAPAERWPKTGLVYISFFGRDKRVERMGQSYPVKAPPLYGAAITAFFSSFICILVRYIAFFVIFMDIICEYCAYFNCVWAEILL